MENISNLFKKSEKKLGEESKDERSRSGFF
jgi:hypothetical protein